MGRLEVRRAFGRAISRDNLWSMGPRLCCKQARVPDNKLAESRLSPSSSNHHHHQATAPFILGAFLQLTVIFVRTHGTVQFVDMAPGSKGRPGKRRQSVIESSDEEATVPAANTSTRKSKRTRKQSTKAVEIGTYQRICSFTYVLINRLKTLRNKWPVINARSLPSKSRYRQWRQHRPRPVPRLRHKLPW